jgi:hypothetical protein
MNAKFFETKKFEGRETICPSCAGFISVREAFCPACSASIGLPLHNDPVLRLPTEGLAYGRAVRGKPKLVVVIGIWVLFLPLLGMALSLLIMILFNGAGTGTVGFVLFLLIVGFAYFASMMLYRVTRNYFKYKKTDRP